MSDSLIAPSMFHATPFWNITPIIRTGIDPALSRGQLPFSWYCTENRVSWSIEHVAQKYACSIHDVVVFEVVERPKAFFFIAAQLHVFRCGVILRPNAMYPAYNWFPFER